MIGIAQTEKLKTFILCHLLFFSSVLSLSSLLYLCVFESRLLLFFLLYLSRSIFAYAILRSYFVSCFILSFYFKHIFYIRVYCTVYTLHDPFIPATRSLLRFGIRNRIVYIVAFIWANEDWIQCFKHKAIASRKRKCKRIECILSFFLLSIQMVMATEHSISVRKT